MSAVSTPKSPLSSAPELVQIILHKQFVTDQQIHPDFEQADVILAAYQPHVGMSAMLL
ncbi:MAG: hypothetical protein ACPGWR_00605 [Ardenticatenaceae bacterium]